MTFQLRCVSGNNNMSELWLHVSQCALMWIIGLMYEALCFVRGFGLKVGVMTWVLRLHVWGLLGLVCVKFVMGLWFQQCLYERYFGFRILPLYMRDIWFGCSLEFGISSSWLVFV